jgi:hypothetical protein
VHVKIKPKADDGISNVVKVQVDDDFCIKSLNVGGISGLGTLGGVHDMPSMLPFGNISSGMSIY